MYRRIICLVSFALLLSLSGTVQGTDYYVSPSGNDGAAGTSPSTAWQTIDRVNDVDLDAGDSVSFEGGQTFTINEAAGEYLFFDAADAGTAANPVTIGSYGTGRATLSTGSSVGLYAKDCGGMVVQDLIFVGNDTGADGDKGIAFWNSQPGLVDYVRIDNVRVSTYRKGIELGGWTDSGANSGYSDVRITNADIYDCGEMAIFIWGDEDNTSLANQNVYIGDCVIHDNLGVSGMSPHSGNGIIVSNTDGGLVEYCESYNNGQYNDAGGGGPVGIWLYLCNNVVFQYCEAHNNKTNGGDGGGFDIDGGATNCIVQYNYSHDNHGPGYQYAQYRGA
ncbi:MAG: right-handed parallel beta-helix repeat-containing protein, partial [Planctomycetota bacterium]